MLFLGSAARFLHSHAKEEFGKCNIVSGLLLIYSHNSTNERCNEKYHLICFKIHHHLISSRSFISFQTMSTTTSLLAIVLPMFFTVCNSRSADDAFLIFLKKEIHLSLCTFYISKSFAMESHQAEVRSSSHHLHPIFTKINMCF